MKWKSDLHGKWEDKLKKETAAVKTYLNGQYSFFYNGCQKITLHIEYFLFVMYLYSLIWFSIHTNY